MADLPESTFRKYANLSRRAASLPSTPATSAASYRNFAGGCSPRSSTARALRSAVNGRPDAIAESNDSNNASRDGGAASSSGLSAASTSPYFLAAANAFASSSGPATTEPDINAATKNTAINPYLCSTMNTSTVT